MYISIIAIAALVLGSLVSSVNASTEKLPPPEGPFCDDPSNPGSCYDRNDNPEEYCLKYDDQDFCELIGDLCDEDGSIKPDDDYCKSD